MNLFNIYPLFPITPIKAKGAKVWDKNGKEYLDFYGGHAVISIGHSHPHYVQKLQEQIQNIGFYSNSVESDLQVAFAKKLGEISGYSNYDLFLCNSGAEANENALKLASFHNKKKKFIAFEKGFHGRTSLAVGVTDNPKIQAAANTHEVIFIPLNSLEKVKSEIDKGDTCAVIIEGIQGIGGAIVPEKKFLEDLSKLCQENDVVLILDEVQSGYGRSGKFFAHQYAKIQPDLITVAKGMGNGFPVGGLLISPKFEPSYGLLGTTFGGNYLACAAGLAVLEVIEQENLICQAQKTGKKLMAQLQNLPLVKEVRGKGLLIGIDLVVPAKDIRQQLLFEKHIFTGSASCPNTLRLLPPLNITAMEVEQFITAFKAILENCKK